MPTLKNAAVLLGILEQAKELEIPADTDAD